MKRFKILLMLLALLAFQADAHQRAVKVTGYVMDANNDPIPGVNVLEKGTVNGTVTDVTGYFELLTSSPDAILVISFVGYETQEVKVDNQSSLNVTLDYDVNELSEVEVMGYATQHKREMTNSISSLQGRAAGVYVTGSYHDQIRIPHNTEEYSPINELGFKGALKQPLSTFSIDVDAASYSNMRRFLESGQRPPVDAVRIEEMINYFDYDYAEPEGDVPFSIHTEVSEAPWNSNHKLVHIGLQGKNIPKENLPASNLVFLIDVSGSMGEPNKLPLLKSAFRLLVNELRSQDKVAIVVYAGAAGTVLPPTSGSEKETILQALDRLNAGGSTAGAAGINLAYQLAEENFMKEGNNRVILATDGDFNIGTSSTGDLQRLIEEKRDKQIYLTALGFGMGNYKDTKLETLADKGNGNYAYIDGLSEAKKVFVNEFGGTMFTIANDVKLQVEFNPAQVQAYRLIGYENRMLQAEDFNNDKKDAGEMGSGHSVTALYEIIPVGVKSKFHDVDELKYQKKQTINSSDSDELLYVKIRYKDPGSTKSKKLEVPVLPSDITFEETTENFRWSAAVACFGMILRQSEFSNGAQIADVRTWAQAARGQDAHGYRGEFMRMLELGEVMASNK
jgi:Ca-activated chloride channel family protein